MPLFLSNLPAETIRSLTSVYGYYDDYDLALGIKDGTNSANNTPFKTPGPQSLLPHIASSTSQIIDKVFNPLFLSVPPTKEAVTEAFKRTPQLAFLDGQQNFIIDHPNKRRDNLLTASVVQSEPMPAGSFRQLNDYICIPSPELAFVQLAARLSFIDLLMFGYELCGWYRLNPFSSRGMDYAAPATSPERIIAFASKLENAPGKRQALKTAKYLLADSRSPQESTVVVVLCLPRHYGGYATIRPVLNMVLPNTDGLACDFLWYFMRLALEYESDLCHTGRSRITKDSKRRVKLDAAGIKVLTLTNDQFRDYYAFEELVHHIHRELGMRPRPNEDQFFGKRLELRKQLLQQGRFF